MAARKTTDLTALTAPTANTLVPAVDLTEALPSNQNKKLTLGDLTQGLNPATTGAAGVVQLSTSTSSTSTTQAATPSAVKSAYDLANAAAIKPLYYRLNSTLTGSNGTSAQAILGVGVSLAASTVYEFEASFLLGKTAGTTSHHILFGFGGTATINNIGWQTVGNVNTTVNGGSASIGTVYGASATAVQATGTIAAATLYATILLRGTVSINGAGTFIPQYTLSAAPGGAYIVQPGSYMKVWALGASGSNSINGTWS